jgi:hypothetical protein
MSKESAFCGSAERQEGKMSLKLKLAFAGAFVVGIVATEMPLAPTARAQDPYQALARTCMQAYGADMQRCTCWAHAVLSMLSPEDLQAVMAGYDTPGSQRAIRYAEQTCGLG